MKIDRLTDYKLRIEARLHGCTTISNLQSVNLSICQFFPRVPAEADCNDDGEQADARGDGEHCVVNLLRGLELRLDVARLPFGRAQVELEARDQVAVAAQRPGGQPGQP